MYAHVAPYSADSLCSLAVREHVLLNTVTELVVSVQRLRACERGRLAMVPAIAVAKRILAVTAFVQTAVVHSVRLLPVVVDLDRKMILRVLLVTALDVRAKIALRALDAVARFRLAFSTSVTAI